MRKSCWKRDNLQTIIVVQLNNVTGETEDTAHLETSKLSLKIISAEHQRLWKISTGKEQGLLGQEFATVIKINVKENILVKSKGGVLNELWKNELTDKRNKDQRSTKIMGKNPIDSLRGVNSHFKKLWNFPESRKEAYNTGKCF